MTRPRHTLITGATGALGGALAREHAARGDRLTLQGRRPAALARIAAECQGLGSEVTTQAVDLAAPEALAEWLAVQATDPPERLIASAGLNAHPAGDTILEADADSAAILEVNLRAPLQLIRTLAPAMADRGRGEILLISSLAAWHGLAVAPTYSATKAALKAYGEALAGRLRPHGVAVTVVMPGYFDSPMARAMPGPHPAMQSPETAARHVRRAADRQRLMIAFPQPLAMGCRWLGLAPRAISHRILRLLGYAPR